MMNERGRGTHAPQVVSGNCSERSRGVSLPRGAEKSREPGVVSVGDSSCHDRRHPCSHNPQFRICGAR